MTAVIHQLNISRGGVPKLPIAQARATRLGLSGDACAKPGIHGGPTRALSLLGLEVIEKLASAGHPIRPGTTGENLTISGLDWSRLGPGMRLRLGRGVLIEILSYAAPCMSIAGSFSDGDVSRLAAKLAPGQSRLYAAVLEEGELRTGDPVQVISEAAAVLAQPVTAPREQSDPATRLRLGYVNLYVSDLERSLAFFTTTLGLGLQFADQSFGYASLDAGPLRMGLARINTADPQFSGMTGRQTGFGFMVDDLTKTHSELEARGVVFTMKPMRQPWGGFMALFQDPDGNVFYLDEAEKEK